MTEELCYLPASEAVALFRRRELSPVELMQATVDRVEDLDGVVNALPVRFFDEALAAARAAEARYAGRGPEPRPLEGLPVAVKDEVEVAGQPCTEGSLILKDAVAERTAACIQRIIDAGGIIHARSATPEFCCAAITDSRLWGVTRNPWNLEYSPGGSSGGSAAALAAGMASLATGSDIGGSIRIPASFCGVVGFKPPYGRVPQEPPFNLDHYCHDGPMARTVEDCRLLENVMAGPHRDDIVSLRPKLTIPADLPGVGGLRIAASADLGGFEVTAEVRENLRDAADVFRSLGAAVDEVGLASRHGRRARGGPGALRRHLRQPDPPVAGPAPRPHDDATPSRSPRTPASRTSATTARWRSRARSTRRSRTSSRTTTSSSRPCSACPP